MGRFSMLSFFASIFASIDHRFFFSMYKRSIYSSSVNFRVFVRVFSMIFIVRSIILSTEVFFDLFTRDWFEITKENLMVENFDVVMFYIGNFFLLIGTGYPYDFIVGLAKVDGSVSDFIFVNGIR